MFRMWKKIYDKAKNCPNYGYNIYHSKLKTE